MSTFFWICLGIDLVIWLICFFESMSSSNRSMIFPLLIMSACVGFAWWYRSSNPKLAMIIAAAPAGLVVVFVAFMLLMLLLGDNNWQ